MLKTMLNPQIKVKIVADSINGYSGVRITTFEYEAPRIILAEINTHRVFSRNASSTRAIPVKTLIKQIWDNPFTPTYWGSNQPGMQAKDELSGVKLALAKFGWNIGSKVACSLALFLSKVGLHKQIAGRVLEPWMMVKGVITSTELENWYTLRNHPDAQPEIQDLAYKMKCAQSQSTPKRLFHGQWHLPYVDTIEEGSFDTATQYYFDEAGNKISLDMAQKISASCCAQVSYRKNDSSLEKAETIFDRLVSSKPAHMSPVEHQATPIVTSNPNTFVANFRTWKQFRTILESKQ